MGLLAALLAAIAYGAATIVQAVGVRRMAARRRSGVMLYAVGLVVDLLGFVISVVALRRLPLFLVESAVASSVAVTALLSVWFLGVRLVGREMVALGLVLAGLVALALAAEPGPAQRVPSYLTLLLWLGVLLALVLIGVGMLLRGSVSAVALSVGAGLGFGGVGVAARVLPGHLGVALVEDPRAWALAIYGVISAVAYGFALERGRVTTVAAITFAVETLVPSALGLMLLGDRMRGHLTGLGIVGFVLTLGACVALARLAEPPMNAETTGAQSGGGRR